MRSNLVSLLCSAALSFALAAAEAPGTPTAQKVIPPPGIPLPPADKAELESGLKLLDAAIAKLQASLPDKPELLTLLPDVQIYQKAIAVALSHNEFLSEKDIASAKTLLKHGLERAEQLAQDKAPWATATGLVPRGYVSNIDGSIQPYGLVVPAEYKPGDAPRRLDFWFHGRDETLTELKFISEREKNPGQFTPPGAFVLHLYGRFCNANHFAGEVDLFEALERVKSQYPIDTNRLVVRGFSMGGAACWHFAAHHAGLWAAAAPGAGFAETAQYAHLDPATVPWYEQKLWHMYDATDYAANLFNCPIVAYSGELDPQRQAANVMAKAMAEEGLKLPQVIGSLTKHAYHKDSIPELNKMVDGFVKDGRVVTPRQLRFTTWTLKYNQMKWVTVDGLEEHWQRARVEAELADKSVTITTVNVSALTLHLENGQAPFRGKPKLSIDGQEVAAPEAGADKSWKVSLVKKDKVWSTGTLEAARLHKVHDLQGPIDDAFMQKFIMVRPTGKPLNAKTAEWVEREFQRAVEHWRRLFRGAARIVDDTAVTAADIASGNLVLWGDPGSNAVYAKIALQLPLAWDEKGIHARGKDFAADHHVLSMIYPNPLNPKHYVVLNSGFTYMLNSNGSNARHISMLPDWAVLNVAPGTPVDGKVEDADFFGEAWEVKPAVEHP